MQYESQMFHFGLELKYLEVHGDRSLPSSGIIWAEIR